MAKIERSLVSGDGGADFACRRCGAKARWIGLESDPSGGSADLATFECGSCGHLQAAVVPRHEDQSLLLRELRHRTQNLITVVHSIAQLTLRKCDKDEKQEFLDRLVALGRAQTLLADASWQGVGLPEIIERETAAFSKQLTVAACDIILIPTAAQHFALIVHELATNALKYGSLSVPHGRVLIECKTRRENGAKMFSFFWREADGPAVAPPVRKGFGSTILIEASREISQSVSMNFEPSGLTYELISPLAAIALAPRTPVDGELGLIGA